jgi:hypothetical protein
MSEGIKRRNVLAAIGAFLTGLLPVALRASARPVEGFDAKSADATQRIQWDAKTKVRITTCYANGRPVVLVVQNESRIAHAELCMGDIFKTWTCWGIASNGRSIHLGDVEEGAPESLLLPNGVRVAQVGVTMLWRPVTKYAGEGDVVALLKKWVMDQA